jgi:hypothetical protein
MRSHLQFSGGKYACLFFEPHASTFEGAEVRLNLVVFSWWQ